MQPGRNAYTSIFTEKYWRQNASNNCMKYKVNLFHRKEKIIDQHLYFFSLCFPAPPGLRYICTSYLWVWYISYSRKSSWGFGVLWHNHTFSCFLAGVNHTHRFGVRNCRVSSPPCTQAQLKESKFSIGTIIIKHSDLKWHWYFTCAFRFFAPLPSNVKKSLCF